MKRKVASRKLKRPCTYCNRHFIKGEVYYKQRLVYKEEGELHAYEHLICPKCTYKQTHQQHRYKTFINSNTCHHPLTNMVYMPIPGEPVVQQPSHEECLICKEHI